MLVKDRTHKVSTWLGRPTEARDPLCPCRPCWHPHDCGHFNHKEWVRDMQCLTRYKNGCPEEEKRMATHEYTPHGQKCIRCGAPKPPIDKGSQTSEIAPLKT